MGFPWGFAKVKPAPAQGETNPKPCADEKGSCRRLSVESARLAWLAGDYACLPDGADIDHVMLESMGLDDIEAELQATHQARGALSIVSRRVRERMSVPAFAPSRTLQARALDRLDRWAVTLYRREIALAAEWRRRCPLPHPPTLWARIKMRFASFCRRRHRPIPSTDCLA